MPLTAARHLYVSDVDSTLLRTDGSLSRFTRDTLNRLIADGLQFTVASARSCASLRQLLAGLDLRLPVVEFNGSFVSDFATGYHHLTHSMAPTVTTDLFTLLQRRGHVPFISTHDGHDGRTDRLYYDQLANAGMRWYAQDRQQRRDSRLRKLANLHHALHDQVVSFTIIARQPELLALQRTIHRHHRAAVQTYLFENHYSPGWFWLTVHDAAATKERGVAALRRLRPELQTSRLIVFGDGDNDLDLFQAADQALAVANATPTLKRHATALIASNDHDGVARYLRARTSRR